MNHPYMTVTVNCKQFQLLERFTVIIYNKTSNLDSVNEARRELFSQKKQANGKDSPNPRETLLQHTLRRSLPSWNRATSDQCEQKASNPRGLWMDSRECKRRPGVLCGPIGLQRTGQVWLQKAPRAEDDAHARKAQWKCTENMQLPM
ncbi:hypothetical protein GWK47_016028 [Chionoecetes opilio]|uniref:Uncharacterized protein n=1 Tax=Chionoecetes opilio TaxID=41210 RepID=A0A8J5CJV3_CHIOP|nr:hypothetical protein GWK47_016028 [Chionoecetes opilio]